MKAPFTPAKLSAAIVTLSLMSAPLYTAAQTPSDDTAEAAERVERAADNSAAIEESSYDTQQAAEALTDDSEQAAAESEQETDQAAAEIEQESEETAAEAEQTTEQAAAEFEEDSEQAAAELEQETDEAAAETEQTIEQAAVETEQETEQAAAEAEQETEQAAADIENETEVAAAATTDADDEDMSGPMEDVQESVEVVQTMQQEADMQQLLDRAKGVFIVPDYAVAALIIGGSGGEGVLLKKEEGGEWSNPVFYNVGGVSAGLQAGAAAGSIAMILLSDNAMESFGSETNFGLTADAGYSIINWSERARAEIGMGTDAVVWTDTEGLFGELAVGVTGIAPDEDEIAEYYEKEVQPSEILAGDVDNPHEQMLQQALREQ